VHIRIPIFATLIIAFALWAGCDTGISGDAFKNQPPDTDLSVRDTSLVDNLAGSDRLKSTVFVSWTGSDPDGFVSSFELRFFDRGDRPGAEEGWSRTTSNDSLILLPIPRGQRVADVVFEVRAIDNSGAIDPSPAQSVFPIQNTPPDIRLSSFDLPPDTTFSVFTFAWTASDPEGESNLERIDVSLNDSTNFVALPPDVDFATFVGQDDGGTNTAEARVFTGRGFQSTTIRAPGLLLDAENTFYIRAVDATDTTSVMQRFTWHVKKPHGEVLYVNDYRKAANPLISRFHLALLHDYLPDDVAVDVWNIAEPFVTGNTGNVPRSDALPPNADPTLRLTFSLFKYIYWVSTNTTNTIQGNNLPFSAGVMGDFFDQGGKLMVHSPVSLPINAEDNLGNPAILLLPLTGMISFPDSLRPSLRLPTGAAVNPVGGTVPGTGESLPPLKADAFVISTLPYVTGGTNTIPLYEADYTYLTRQGGRSGPWFGSKVVASLSLDRRVGLFALPLVNEQSGTPLFSGVGGDPADAERAVDLMLESLGFPKR